MKKYLFNIFVLVLATMVGCQKSEVEGVLEEPNNSANKITVTADIVNEGQTRVALTPDTDGEGKPVVKVDWRTSGEKEKFDVYGIGYTGLVGPTNFVQIEGTNQFEGSLPNNEVCDYYLATYPIGAFHNAGSLAYDNSIFTSQNGQLSEDKTLMLTQTYYTLNENTKLYFTHLTTLLMPKFRVQGATVNLSPANIQTITFKSMSINGGNADFNVDCTALEAEDDIYVYLPQNSTNGKNKIEVVVTTRDAKIYDGEIDITGATLESGKLYTANVWLYESNVITYTTTDDTILTLSNAWGEGDACVYTSHTFADGVGRIVLKDGVTTLPANAFKRQEKLMSFVLPTQITTIGDSAFQQCCYLESISMPNITVIGNSAFDMDGLHWPDYDLGETLKVTYLDLSKVTTLGNRALFKLVSLQSIDISGAISIGENVFYECGKLTSVKMPKQDCTLGASAFKACRLTNIDLSYITSIGDEAFGRMNQPTSIVINRATPPTIGANILYESNPEIKIYVPDSKVDTYKAITNLVQYADKIKPLSEM